jgi:peptidyl-prolyl cis-trans isomerase C
MKLGRFSIIAAVLAASVLSGCGQKSKGGGAVVADVGGRKVTASDLLVVYDNITPPNRPPFDTLEQKKAFLDVVISKEILLGEAEARGLDKSTTVVNGVKTQRDQELFRRLFQEKAQKSVQMTPEEVEAHYKKTHTELNLRDIWVDGEGAEARANKILSDLRAGADFAEMAKKHSQNEYAAKGGDMGWQIASTPSLGLFNAELPQLQPGDISNPVPVGTGFHIIQLVERRPPDMAQFEQKAIGVRNSLRQVKERQAWREYLEELRVSSGLKLMDENVEMIKQKWAGVTGDAVPEFTEQEKALPLATYNGGTWTVNDLLFFLGSVGMPFKPNFADPKFDTTGWLTARAMNHVLLRTAEQMGFEKESAIVESIRRKREELMLDELHAALIKDVSVSEEEKLAFYEAKRESLNAPAKATVRVIISMNAGRADSAYGAINAGVPVEEVVRRFSDDPATRENGGLVDSLRQGVFQSPAMDQAIFALNPGETSLPIAFNNGYYIFHMIKKYRGAPLTYEQAKETVTTLVQALKQVELFDSWLTNKRQSLDIKVYDDALNAIQAEQTGA